MDQRSGDGWFSGWSEIFVFCMRNSHAEFWSTRFEKCFITEQNHPEYPLQEKCQSGGNESIRRRPIPSRKTDRLLDLPILLDHSNPIGWHLGKLVQIQNTRVWEAQDRIGIVWPGDSSEENRTWLSQVGDDGEKKYRAESTNEEFWSEEWKFWN